MKGYNFPLIEYKPVEEDTYVGCRGCGFTWYEKRTHYSSARINGPLYSYDYCDKCKRLDKTGNIGYNGQNTK